MAQNPVKRDDYAVVTFGRNVFLSRNGARTSTQIAKDGECK